MDDRVRDGIPHRDRKAENGESCGALSTGAMALLILSPSLTSSSSAFGVVRERPARLRMTPTGNLIFATLKLHSACLSRVRDRFAHLSRAMGQYEVYAKIADHTFSTRRCRADGAGDCLGPAESGYPRSTQSTGVRSSRRSRQETGYHSQEGPWEKYNCSHTQDPEGKGQLRLGDEDRRRSSQARRKCGH